MRKTKQYILDDLHSWGWFPVDATWDQAVKEGLIKPLDEHYWIWHENYESEKKKLKGDSAILV